MRILHGGTAAVILALGCSTPPAFEVVRGSDSRPCAREARPAAGCADLAIIVDASRSTIDLMRDAAPRRSADGELVQEGDSILAAELEAIEFLLGRTDAQHQALSIVACGGVPPRDVSTELRDAGAAETWLQVGLTNDAAAVHRGLVQIWSRGSSATCNLAWATALAWEILRFSPSETQTVLFLTDGHLIAPLGVRKRNGPDGEEIEDLSANWSSVRPQVEVMHAAGVRFHVLAVRPTVDLSGAAALARDGGGTLRRADDLEGARWALLGLVEAGGQDGASALDAPPHN